MQMQIQTPKNFRIRQYDVDPDPTFCFDADLISGCSLIGKLVVYIIRVQLNF